MEACTVPQPLNPYLGVRNEPQSLRFCSVLPTAMCQCQSLSVTCFPVPKQNQDLLIWCSFLYREPSERISPVTSMSALGFLGLPCFIFNVVSALICTFPTGSTFRGFSWAALLCWEDGTSEAKLHLFLPDFPSLPGTGCCILARGLALWNILCAFCGWHGVLHHCSGKLLTVIQHCRPVWLSWVEDNEMLISQSLLYILVLDPVVWLKISMFYSTVLVASSKSHFAEKLLARVGGVLWSWHFIRWDELISSLTQAKEGIFHAQLHCLMSDSAGACWVLWEPVTLISPE